MAFKSQFEKNVAKAFRQAGIKFLYEPKVVEFVQPAKKRKYTPDFEIKTKEAGTLFVETKGRLTTADRQKLVMVRESNPRLKLILLFMNSQVPIRKGSKTTYSDWCDKNNFQYYDFRFGLPKEWK